MTKTLEKRVRELGSRGLGGMGSRREGVRESK